MRYAIFTDVHANLEALEAVLAKIDELAQQEPIDQIWFLGDLVGYGPDPNECIVLLRQRTDVMIAGNHDWAAVGKIDLDDFSAAARISAEWTAERLTPEHREFLINLPERIEIDECTLVHGSPYGPLWEYLTSEVLAERSFQCFHSRYCFVGHTHIPLIFQQPDTIANTPTLPLAVQSEASVKNGESPHTDVEEGEVAEAVAVRPAMQTMQGTSHKESALTDTVPTVVASTPDSTLEADAPTGEMIDAISAHDSSAEETEDVPHEAPAPEQVSEEDTAEAGNDTPLASVNPEQDTVERDADEEQAADKTEEPHTEATLLHAEERFNDEIEELLSLLGLSQSMIKTTNEMIVPPEGDWQAPEDYRAIINPGGVGQPRDGDPRAAFMIYDTERGFTFYRIPYPFEKTQEKIIQAGLPQYLATRLAYGR
jgi:diadenosine tetraphosphatase ApaH/serine/threonine PP2A family protein phosphatase